jgi:hypothetical protein
MNGQRGKQFLYELLSLRFSLRSIGAGRAVRHFQQTYN